MSLLQIWIERNRARIAVDSIGNGGGVREGKAEVSKLLPLAHAGVVLAYRGTDLAFLRVFAQLFLGSGSDHYDEIVEAIPNRCTPEQTNWPLDSDIPSTCEIAVAGFSEALGQMAATVFTVDLAAGTTHTHKVTPPGVSAPGFSDIPNLSTDAGMHVLASRQVAWMVENKPDGVTGGRLLVAEVRRGSITIRDAGKIR